MEKQNPSLEPLSNKSPSSPSGDTLTPIINPTSNNLQGESIMKTPWQVLEELCGESSDDDSGGEDDLGGGSGNYRREENGVSGGSSDDNNNNDGVGGRSSGGAPPVAVAVAVGGDGGGSGGRMEMVEGAVVKEGVLAKKRKTSIVRDPPMGKPTCPLCFKEFPSWKGAFGHMRAHPDRDYRGFFKPPAFGSPSSTKGNKGNTSQSGDGENKSTGEVNHGEKGPSLPPIQALMFDLNEPPAKENAAEPVAEKTDENGMIFRFDLNAAEGSVVGFDLNKMPSAEE
ncbi:unnamed protein product [Sphenostylis stenocarpa]|uniref:C2H2-type domain-containing protein n=1 Tax=Sphenostylis stenocarpa TaxID=92480 RepID=A0AA86VDD5_9FABA|nr:unnamed protein product [Sphenostylis stenocarpa]